MTRHFKRVPAIDKGFAILKLLSESTPPLGISEISNRLSLSKSTVYHLMYTLEDLEIVEQTSEGKFQFGLQLYLLGNLSGRRSALIQTAHPYLEKINRATKLSAFLGIRSGMHAVIVDKVDSAFDIKVSSEIGMRLPLLAGAGGKALLSMLPDEEIDRFLNDANLKKFTPRTSTDKARFKQAVIRVREECFAFDDQEYIDGIVALAVPIKARQPELQAAIWAVGLKQQAGKDRLSSARKLMVDTADKLSARFMLTDLFN
jgi:IclR family KDG regulon transcriptional repressor